MNNTFQITDTAKKQIIYLLKNEPKGSFFRVSVEGGGCSGFKYNFSVDNNKTSSDILIDNVLIDETSLNFLKNSTLDHEENLMTKSFRIKNPDAKASCGCGISFSI